MKQKPLIWISITKGIYSVHQVENWQGLPATDTGFLPITPPISEFLYIALTGHGWGVSGENISLQWARSNRAFIMKCQMTPTPICTPSQALILSQLNTARQLISDFGQYIQPWLGLYLVKRDKNNSITFQFHPHYFTRLSLLQNIYELNHIIGN